MIHTNQGRKTLGLYNSYDKTKIREAHRRALARAGPVALAFDCNLATFGFPFDRDMRTPAEIVEWISETTSIGDNGQYLIKLAQAGRFQTFDMPKKGFPPQLGTVIVTTRKPAAQKAIRPGELARQIDRGESVLLLVGLGPHGLPKKIFDIGQHHLDITGKGLSLETCTAMGIIPAVLSTINRKL